MFACACMNICVCVYVFMYTGVCIRDCVSETSREPETKRDGECVSARMPRHSAPAGRDDEASDKSPPRETTFAPSRTQEEVDYWLKVASAGISRPPQR